MNKNLKLILGVAASLIVASPAEATETNLTSAPLSSAKAKQRSIVKVDAVNVETPVGTCPRLPFQLLVTYSDGTREWRQVKWSNSLLSTEQQESSAELYPVGKQYTVKGYIIGDNSTDKGYPVTANVTVTDKAWEVPDAPKAHTLPLSSITIEGNNRLTSNRDLDIKTLLNLDITQQLYNYRDTYGLPTEGYTEADGWDSPTTKLKGHGTGHFMSALAFAFASAKDYETKKELFLRIERIVNELRACQERTFVYSDSLGRYFEARDYAPEAQLKEMKGTWAAFDQYKKDYKHYGYGYINAIPAAHPALIECYRAYNNEDWVWAPYYTIHKQLAGLIDIANNLRSNKDIKQEDNFVAPQGHLTTDQVADKAYQIAKDMGLWVWNRLHYRTYVKEDGTKAERQAKPGNRYEMWNMYIAGEVGGMEESLSRLAEMTSDATEKAHLIEAANCFDAPAFFKPVASNVDDIRTRHANQHIPMITGALRSYLTNKNPFYYNLAYNFWTLVQGRYAYAMGGVGNGEMFRQPYSQILSMNTSVESDWHRNMFPNPDINETCCAYNLAKLTKDLNTFDPDNAAYMDYYERILFNQIIGSLNPKEWAVCYQYAVGMNAIKPYGNETPQSTCCGGTGVENHVKYQEAEYFANDNTLWVGLYLPSTAKWNGMTIKQDCTWPAEKSTITFDGGKNFTLKLRVPYWATEGFDVKLNGKSIAKSYQPSSYVEIPARDWTSSDVVEVIMPFTKHINWGPDKMELAATGKNETRTPFDPQWVGTIMYGPFVMATPEVKEWKDADVNLSSNLAEITLNGANGTDDTNGPLYSLSLLQKNALSTQSSTLNFTPDYYQTDHSTHYLRLNVLSATKAKAKKGIDKTDLQEAIQIAHERIDSQNAWNALTVKVPNFSPWAPNGYQRLLTQTKAAEAVLAEQKPTQEELNKAASALNVAINTMRPGNLAEPEDLNDLLPLVTESKNIENKTTELREAINYADMVISYVNDGSGTQDLITKALNRLQTARKNMKK